MALEQPDVLKVFSLLRHSTLQGPSVNPLSDYEGRPGFFSCLVDIITAEGPPSDDDVRLSAANYFQEAIMRYWENNRPSISRYEKTNLRNRLLSHLQEENDQKIAQALVITISKIARFDYPRGWPELFSVLTKQLEKGHLLTSHRILEVLSHTIPTLPTDVIPEISSRLFHYCWQLWKKDQGIVYQYLTSYSSIEKNTSMGQQQDLTFERWSLCLSIIQMLNVFDFRGVAKFEKVPPVEELCRELVRAIESLVIFYSISPVHPKLNSVHRICVNLMKDLVEIQWWNSSFLGDETVRDHIVKFCLNTIINSSDEKSPLFEQLVIKCMVMLKSVLDCIHKPLMCVSDITMVVRRDFGAEFVPILPDHCVEDLCKILIKRYFLLTENDLKERSEDPERFYFETKSLLTLDRIEKLRLQAEDLFINVFRRYTRLLRPVVVSIFREATKDRPAKETDSDPEMFFREAAYTAVAHVYYGLSNELPFEKLFKEVFNPELQSNHRPDMRIIHQKIAFIVNTLKYQVEGDMRKEVLCALLKLLEYDDLVVRLTACLPLKYLVEIYSQEKKSIDLLHSYWSLCFRLLADVQQIYSKRFVLDCILSIIVRIGEKFQKNSAITNIGQMIFPFVDQLANEIEKVWDVSNIRTNYQCTILQALSFLSEFEILSPVIYKILRPTVDKLSLMKSYDTFGCLMYVLQLWESTISKAPSSNSELFVLFPYLLEIMKNTLDDFPRSIAYFRGHLPVAIKIIDGYMKLGGGRFLCEHASVIHKLLLCIDAILDFNPNKFGGTEGTRIANKVEALKGKLNDTTTPVEEQEDEKNICALGEIKEKPRCSSSSGVYMMRVQKMLCDDWRKLEVSIRPAGMSPDCPSISAAVELGKTLQRVFVTWDLGSDIDMATGPPGGDSSRGN